MAREKQVRIPFVLLSFRSMEEIARRMGGLGRVLRALHPKLDMELEALGIPLKGEYYSVGSFFSALLYAVLISIVVLAAMMTSPAMTEDMRLRYTLAIGFSFFFVFFMLHIIYPSIIVKKIAVRSEKDLLYALREVMLSINSGIPLFDAIKNVSLGDYGQISSDFAIVVKQVESGTPMKEALKAQVLLSESEYFRRALWQMINALESGASMTTALPGIVESLENHTYRTIRSYSSNLNFLMLIYMLIAAAIPSLGITFLVLLSAFSGFGITLDKIFMLIIGAAIGQILLISYMSSTRPDIFGG